MAPESIPLPELSFVVPVHDERDSLPALLAEIRAAAGSLGRPWEMVVVDDGSKDGTGSWLAEEADRAGDLVLVTFAKNRGQSAAMAAGLENARGAVIVTMDGDGQNDPADTARLLAALEGCDLATGVRAKRRDTAWKRFGSRIGNGVRRLFLKDRFRDVGCQLRAWTPEAARRVPKFKGFHRFIPVLVQALGLKVVEVEVAHRPRSGGRTHYGNLGRAWSGLRDLFGVAWLVRRLVRTDATVAPRRSEPAPR